MATYFGTTINESPTIVLPAGAKIEAAQGKAVIISEGTAKLATAGANAIGLIPLSEDETIAQGDDVVIQVKDIGAWVAGEKIAVGDELTSNATGQAVKVADGNFITAIALTAADKAGTIIRVQLIKAGYKPAETANA
ncbi:MAG: hypothetical protein BACD_02887 [Bacteroides rodentium]